MQLKRTPRNAILVIAAVTAVVLAYFLSHDFRVIVDSVGDASQWLRRFGFPLVYLVAIPLIAVMYGFLFVANHAMSARVDRERLRQGLAPKPRRGRQPPMNRRDS
jgi:hypothetical protein